MTKKILMVLTSHDQLGNTGEKTGFWLEEFAAPYYAFKDAGYKIELASPKGGQPPLDPKSEQPDGQTYATRRFHDDPVSINHLATTKKLSEVKEEDFDAIFYPGGHGPLWDLSNNKDSINLIEKFYRHGKPVGAVCHAPAVLLKAKKKDGTPIVAGKNVTGFSNSEEEAVGLSKVVPILCEDSLTDLGGHYKKKDNWESFSVVDGNLFTGQNPASSELVAKDIIRAL
jgi:putative intracellular protease/amidase